MRLCLSFEDSGEEIYIPRPWRWLVQRSSHVTDIPYWFFLPTMTERQWITNQNPQDIDLTSADSHCGRSWASSDKEQRQGLLLNCRCHAIYNNHLVILSKNSRNLLMQLLLLPSEKSHLNDFVWLWALYTPTHAVAFHHYMWAREKTLERLLRGTTSMGPLKTAYHFLL